MGQLAVVAEPFAVIRGEHDERAAALPGLEEGPEQRLQGRIGGGDLAVVRP